MRFDFTKGKEAKYMVIEHFFSVDDYFYYANYREAKKAYDRLIEQKQAAGTAVSLYDMKKDIRKEYYPF